LKGIAEVQGAAKPLPAAEMVLVRIAYAADLPAPEDLVRMLVSPDAPPALSDNPAPADTASAPAAPLRSHGATPAVQAAPAQAPSLAARSEATSPAHTGAPAPRAIAHFEDIVALAAEKRDLMVKTALERDVRPVRVEDGRLDIALEPGASRVLANELARKLSLWTGRR